MSSTIAAGNNGTPKVCPGEQMPPSLIMLFGDVIVCLLMCKICHSVLGRLNQPRIVSELLVGMLVGHLEFFRPMANSLISIFPLAERIVSCIYMFVLALEMETLAILLPREPEAKMAYTGVFMTLIMYVIVTFMIKKISVLQQYDSPLSGDYRLLGISALMYSATASPILTRMVTELKIGQSEIGRRAIRAGLANDLLCTLLMCPIIAVRELDLLKLSVKFGWFVLEMVIVKIPIQYIFNWVNKRNPEGKPMKGSDMGIVLLATQLLCHSSAFVAYDVRMNAFLIGLAMPRHGRVSNFLIGKLNYSLTTFILPVYISMAGINSNLSHWYEKAKLFNRKDKNWVRVIIINVVATIGKLLGTLTVGLHYGLHWLEAITIGLLLNIKGYFVIIHATSARSRKVMDERSFTVVLSVVILSIVYVPIMVAIIIRRVRMIKGRKSKLMGIQWYNPANELRVTVGFYGPENVSSVMVLMEAMKNGVDEAARLVVYALDMVEMTDELALVYREGSNAVMVANNLVVELREQIGHALDSHVLVQEINTTSASGNDVSSTGRSTTSSTTRTVSQTPNNKIALRRSLVLSSFSAMHNDVCCSAQDSLSILIVLPFHKCCLPHNNMNLSSSGHSGFQTVNEKVLQDAPCSVGILVDRGLGDNKIKFPSSSSSSSAAASASAAAAGVSSSNSISNPNMSAALLNILVVFIGGEDDREALACASVMAEHPCVYLMAMRIIQDNESIGKDALGRRMLEAISPIQMEREMKKDDEYFGGFYDHYITNGGVGYTEIHVKNGIQVVDALREIAEGEFKYHLFIVGQGKERVSILTAGLSEWAECPELGPIGDFLAASDFPTNASVLVIQQHNPSRGTAYISDEFMPL